MADQIWDIEVSDQKFFEALDKIEKKLVETGEVGADSAKEIAQAFEFARGFVEGFTEEIEAAAAEVQQQAKVVQAAKKENDAWSKSVKDLIGNFVIGGQSLSQWAQQIRGFAGIVKSGTAATEGMSKSMRIFSIALKATGIGLIVAAFAALIGYFTRFQSGMDKVNRVLASAGAIFDRLITGLTNFGSAISKVFQGDFSGALDSAKQGLSDISVGLVKAAVDAYGLEAAFQALRDTTIAVSIENARNRVELEKQKAVAEDTTKTFRERLAAAQQAGRIEVETAQANLALATTELRLAKEKLLLNKENSDAIKAEQDATIKFSDALIDRNSAVSDAEKRVRDLRKEASEAAKKAAEERKKSLEDERKTLEGLAKDLQKLRLAALGEGLDADLLAVNQKFDELIKVTQNGVNELNKIEARRGLTPEEQAQRQEFADLSVKIEEQRLTAILAVLEEYNEKDAALAKEQLERQKELSERERKELEDRLKAQKDLRDISIQTAEAQAERFLFGLEQQGASEKEIAKTKEQFDLEIQRARLQNELDFQTAMLATLDAGDTARINQAKATIELLQAEIQNITNRLENPKKEPFSIWKILGIEDDNAKEAVKEAAGQIIGAINEIAAARVEAAEAAVEAINRQIEKQEEAINREAELAKQGLANDLDTEKERLAELKKQRDAAAKEEAKARRAQIALDTVQQAVSLITASANIFKSLSGLGPFGVPLAIGLIAAMFGAFVAARARALKAAEPPKFRKGVKLSGPSHEQGGIDMVNQRGEVVGEAEGDEWLIGTGPSREHDRFLKRLNRGEFKGVDLESLVPNRGRYDNRAGEAVERIREIERAKAELSDARHWAALKEAYGQGAERIVKAIEEKPEVMPWKGGYKRRVKKGHVTEVETVIPEN